MRWNRRHASLRRLAGRAFGAPFAPKSFGIVGNRIPTYGHSLTGRAAIIWTRSPLRTDQRDRRTPSNVIDAHYVSPAPHNPKRSALAPWFGVDWTVPSPSRSTRAAASDHHSTSTTHPRLEAFRNPGARGPPAEPDLPRFDPKAAQPASPPLASANTKHVDQERGFSDRPQSIIRPLPADADRHGALLGNSLRVEQRTLTPLVLVRIQVPQPVVFIEKFPLKRQTHRPVWERVWECSWSLRAWRCRFRPSRSRG